MKQKATPRTEWYGGFAPIPILILLVGLGTLGFWAYKTYFSSQPINHPPIQTSPSPTATTEPIVSPIVGQFCGGIAGKICPEGYTCKYDGDYPDAGGVCIKATEEIPPVTASELEMGSYWGAKEQKKPNTPAAWIYMEAGKSSCWHKPGVECKFLPD